jgi:hypothetical protein
MKQERMQHRAVKDVVSAARMNTLQTASSAISTTSSRVVLLDYYRFVAVSLALVSHVLVRLRVFDGSIGPIHVAFKVVTRLALPSLLILFGVMITLAYGQPDRRGKDSSALRITFRLLLCYLAFVLLAAVSVAVGDISLSTFVLAAAVSASILYANIFKVYCFMLAAAMPLLKLRWKAGVWSPAAVALVCFVGASIADGHDGWNSVLLNGYASTVYGYGGAWGPSILHSMILVAFGMSYASFFRKGDHGAADVRVVVSLLIIATLVLAYESMQVGFASLAGGIADFRTYRATNHPVYFAYGMWGAVVMTLMGKVMAIVTPARLSSFVQLSGQNTFTYFLIGNVLVLCLPAARMSYAMCAAITVIVVASSMGWVCLWVNHCRDAAIPRAFFARVRDLAVAVSSILRCRLIFRSSREKSPS